MNDLLKRLNHVAYLSKTSKLSRFLNNPYRYADALFFRLVTYKKDKKEKIVTIETFFGRPMKIALPASTDIYLTGGKSHDSEVRLARYMIQHLLPGDSFLDIGAHYGFFSLLASELTGTTGKVISFEPAESTFSILSANVSSAVHKNIQCFGKAVSDTEEDVVFYEFPNLYSEYNSLSTEQFAEKTWFNELEPKKITIPATTINNITAGNFFPKIIKIDVEGAENKVIKGGALFLKNNNPAVVMEYVESERSNEAHREATDLLKQLGYKSFVINNAGTLDEVSDIEQYLAINKHESDNIVFKK